MVIGYEKYHHYFSTTESKERPIRANKLLKVDFPDDFTIVLGFTVVSGLARTSTLNHAEVATILFHIFSTVI